MADGSSTNVGNGVKVKVNVSATGIEGVVDAEAIGCVGFENTLDGRLHANGKSRNIITAASETFLCMGTPFPNGSKHFRLRTVYFIIAGMMPILISLIIFLGAFTQSLTGFGSALVAMALLSPLLGLAIASPLVAGTALVLEALMLMRYHESLKLDSIWRVLLASLVGAPLGVYFLSRINENIALFALGIVITGYAIYGLTGFRLPDLTHPLWAWITGLMSGMLGGAYNTSGPPVVIYGNCRRWDAGEFKSNLSGFFIINSIIVVTSHLWSGHFTANVIRILPFAFPAMFIGFLAGQTLDRWLSPDLFRKIVLVLLIVLGMRMIASSSI